MVRDRSIAAARLSRSLQALRGRRDPAPLAGQRSRNSNVLGDLHIRKVLDLTIRLAEVMLSSGAGTADVEATAQDVARAYHLTDCVVEIFVTTVFVSAPPTTDSPPITIVRSVQTRSTDYTRVADLDRLVGRITSGGVTVDEAHQAMDELTEQPHPYPRWLSTLGWAGFALGIALLFGGTWLTCILAALTAAVIDRAGRLMNKIRTPFFFQHAIGAMIATLVAVGEYYFFGLGPTTLVATGIVMLLSGMTLVGAMQDAVTGYMVTAMARLGEALFLTGGIVVGILAGLQITELVGVRIELHVDATQTFIVPHGTLPIALAVIGAAVAGVCFTVASYGPPRSALTAGFAAGFAELLLIGLGHARFGQVVATGIAAVGVGVFATVISIRRQAPALVTATAGIMPMLPGLAVFRAVFYLAVDEDFGEGLQQLFSAAAVALALGAGVVLGEFIGSPLRYRAGRVGKFLRVEGPPGLRRAVGAVVHLQPAGEAGPVHTEGERSRSVAMEPDLGDGDSTEDAYGTHDTGHGDSDTEYDRHGGHGGTGPAGGG